MKKWKVWITVATACAMLFAGCGSKNAENVKETDSDKQTEQQEEREPIKIASLKGPTSIGMVKLMDDAEENGKYDVTIYASATEVSPLLISGDVDVANIPANLAAVLYAKTNGNIEVLDINTLGVLYMVGTNRESATFEELKGATIYTTGKGTTPEYTLNYLLEQNGMSPDDFNIEYKSEATEVVAALQSDTEAVGILPQPFVTVAQNQIDGLNILMSFTDEWSRVTESSELVTGVTVVRKDYLEEHEDQIQEFMTDLEASINYVNANTEEMSASVEKYDIIKAAIAKKAIPYCNLSYIAGNEMKDKLGGYLEVLFQQDAQSVGGAVPEDDFYYQAK